MKRDVKEAIDYAVKCGFQVHPAAVRLLNETNVDEVEKVLRDIIRGKSIDRNYHIGLEDLKGYLHLDEPVSLQNEHKILFDCTSDITTPPVAAGYSALFGSRFRKLSHIMEDRPEYKKVRRISAIKTRLSERREGQQREDAVYVCGLVTFKRVDEDFGRLTIEDETGELEGVVYDDDKELLETIFIDQLVMARVDTHRKVVFGDIMMPDIPQHKHNRSESSAMVAFLSDLHIGSKYFMEKEFEDFIRWVNGAEPEARNLRFILIAGDVVDGVGIFPNQDKELVHQTISSQLQKVRELLEHIPKHIKIFIAPGNHDPGRRALPQPAIPVENEQGLWEMENVYMVGNPATISLNGVVVLMFHGQSIDDIVQTTNKMEYNHPVPIMKQMLKSRHLSPIYGNRTPIAPENKDMMVIDAIPDVLHTGHVHVMEVGKYKGVLVVNSGTWQSQTPFQASVGQVPTPCNVVLLNLKSFKVVVRSFSG